jgi:hypothetical protein
MAHGKLQADAPPEHASFPAISTGLQCGVVSAHEDGGIQPTSVALGR